MPRWELWQLGPRALHPGAAVFTTWCPRELPRACCKSQSGYNSILVLQWVFVLAGAGLCAGGGGVLTVWGHACIGIHFWLRTKPWYPALRGSLAVLALLIPTLALAGYVAGGNQILRAAQGAGHDPGYVEICARRRAF